MENRNRQIGSVRMVQFSPSVAFRLDLVQSSRFASVCVSGVDVGILEWVDFSGGLLGNASYGLCYRPRQVVPYDVFVESQGDVGYAVWHKVMPKLNTHTTYADIFYAQVMNFTFYLRSVLWR